MPDFTRNRKNRIFSTTGGFSLLELLIALFLLLVILGASLLLLRTANQNWFRGESEVSVQTEAGNLVFFLNRLIPGAVLAKTGQEQELGFSGYPDRLSFCTLLPENKKETDFARVDIFWDTGEKTLLVFEERVGDERKNRADFDKTGSQPLAFGVKKFELSYFDGKEYKPGWDSGKGSSEEGCLPKAVAVNFRLSGQRSNEGRVFERDFQAVFELKNN